MKITQIQAACALSTFPLLAMPKRFEVSAVKPQAINFAFGSRHRTLRAIR